MTLVIIIGSSAMAALLLRPPSMDALAELKSLPLYPNTTTATFSDTIALANASQLNWVSSGKRTGIWVISTDENRSLDATVATMYFETQDNSGKVHSFYDDAVANRGYWETQDDLLSRKYLRWDMPAEALDGSVLEAILRHEVDQPLTFYNLSITAVDTSKDARNPLTSVSVEMMILQEIGGLR